MKRRAAAWALLTAGWLVCPAPAYYHFVHFPSGPPYTPVYEKFDLKATPDGAVPYFIDAAGPEALGPGDSFAAIVSQIRLAAAVWSQVKTSQLRLVFGGLRAGAGDAAETPHIDVLFDEIPPGLIALGGPTTRGALLAAENGAYVPILRSVVILNRDLSTQRSSSEGFFLTLVHEFGHAIGLQHTLTSSVMSTSITRATSRAKPLAEDDVAGVSLLYPTPQFREKTGLITGRVTLDGAGVHLASVVALSPGGTTVSALTNPDGTYWIAGIPPGSYYVYVHPLPPPLYGEVTPANVVLPRGPTGEPIPPGPLFETEFYPGSKAPETARALVVAAGDVVQGVDFAVRPRAGLDLYAVSTYTFPANVAVPQAFVNLAGTRRFLVMSGVGLSTGTSPAPGLSVSVIGGSAVVPPGGLIAYPPDPRYVQLNLEFHPFSGTGPRHLLFSLNQDIHIRPAGFHLVRTAPPEITTVSPIPGPAGQTAVAILGRNLARGSRVLFDGVLAPVLSYEDGVLVTEPPSAPGGHQSSIVVLNEDGQSSWYVHGTGSPVWQHEAKDQAGFTLSPAALPAGVEAMVEVSGTNTRFRQGQTEIGFGSPEISVRGLWVLSPTRLVANLRLSPAAAGQPVATLVDGIEIAVLSTPFEVLPANGGRLSLVAPVVDELTGKEGGHPGGLASIRLTGLAPGTKAEELAVTVGDQPAAVRALEVDRLRFEVPASLRPGVAVVRVKTPQGESYPLAFTVRPAPPVVLSVRGTGDQEIGPARPARPGEVLVVQAARLGETGETIGPGRVVVEVGGVSHVVEQAVPSPSRPDVWELVFILGLNVPAGEAVPLVISIDGRESPAVNLPVAK